MQAERDVIEPFVRGTLGCGCPDEVFRRIELDTRPACPGRPGFTRLVVGDRLLIYVADLRDGRDVARRMEALVAHGMAERDAKGYHRFRLVVVAGTGSSADDAAEALGAAVGVDDRAHLHCLQAAAVPSALMPAGPD